MKFSIVCLHAKTSFPMTVGGICYVVCLACGSQFEYDWNKMVRGNRIRPPLKKEAATQ